MSSSDLTITPTTMETLSSLSLTTYLLTGILGFGLIYIVRIYMQVFHPGDQWTRYGIKQAKMKDPIAIDFRKNFESLFNENGDTFGMHKNVIVTRDPNLLRQVMVKDFNNFVERNQTVISNSPLGDSLFFAKGHRWRRLRNITSPSFTTGKLKLVSYTIEESASKLADFLYSCAKEDRLVPVKKTTAQYTSEIIARTAFGFKTNGVGGEDDQFTRLAKGIINLPNKFVAKFRLLTNFIPGIMKVLIHILKLESLDFVSKDSNEYFTALVAKTIPDRREIERSGARKPADFLQLIVSAQEAAGGSNAENSLTDDEIIGTSLLIILAGFETTASTLMMMLYLMARYPDVQEKVYKEIESVVKGPAPSLEDLNKLKYTEQVINETLRLYPPAAFVGRKAKETRVYGNITIPAGTMVNIPIYNIHRNPAHFPEPEKFDPDRFTDEAKETRDPMAFIPFGYGPRLCVGMRLALMELKMALAYSMKKVKFELNDKTEPRRGEEVELSFRGLITPVKPIHIACVVRE